MPKYSLGIDFGSLSVRAMILNLGNGQIEAVSSEEYEHGIIEDCLPNGEKLDKEWALQDAQDYLVSMKNIIGVLLSDSKISKDDIIGIGIDFTSSTILPVLKDKTPLSNLEGLRNRPHAYVKLWRHHASKKYADEINELARNEKEEWIYDYGGKISSEWLFPKALQIFREDKEIYDLCDYILEAGDWIVWKLTGKLKRSSCQAGFKAIWNHDNGYPDKSFFRKLDVKFENIVQEKLKGEVCSVGKRAGLLTKEMAEELGLKEGTPVGISIIDAHSALPALGIVEKGKMLAIIGTSTCHIMVSDNYNKINGISGVVKDGIIPGLYAYEAGQACVGDGFNWFVKNFVNQKVTEEASNLNLQIQEYLTEKASNLKVGESGIVALDWWNGNRSTLVDADLSGMIVGMTINTKVEEIYRSLLEATAFGTKRIIEQFNNSNVPVEEFYASGGIPNKNKLMMQIYADVLNMPVYVTNIKHGSLYGAAMFGAVAAGEELGGFRVIKDAALRIGKKEYNVYYPIKKNVEIYKNLYKIYNKLYEYFGVENKNMMYDLKENRNEKN